VRRLASPHWPGPADASATIRRISQRRATSFRDLHPKAFEDRPAHANCSRVAHRNGAADLGWR
jgi:hypothetical protein